MPLVPRSLSATSLEVGNQCPARFQAEYIERNRTARGEPAMLGGVVHTALERYVDLVYIKMGSASDLDLLEMLYQVAYDEIFEVRDNWYDDGMEMITRWYRRSDEEFEDVRVLSVEQKDSFSIKLPDGSEIPFNYIIDRVDELETPDGKRVLRVTDYKTIRLGMTPEQLRRKLQVRTYGLAMQIKYKNDGYDAIQVVYDLLRYTPVGVVLTREDSVATWGMVGRQVTSLYNQDEDEPEERINSSCHYCVRKASCKALAANASAGGLGGLTLEEKVELKAQAGSRAKANEKLVEEIDEELTAYMLEEETTYIAGPRGLGATAKTKGRRYADSKMIARILPEEFIRKYPNFRMGDIDQLLADPALGEDTKKRVRDLIQYRFFDSSIEITGWEGEEE